MVKEIFSIFIEYSICNIMVFWKPGLNKVTRLKLICKNDLKAIQDTKDKDSQKAFQLNIKEVSESYITELINQLDDYFLRKKAIDYPEKYLLFENLSLFNRCVLKCLKSVEFGHTLTYKQLANKSGYSGAFRAVGSVMNKNLYPIIIPCHRVIKSDGSLGGFAPGQNMKKQLLEHENIIL